MECWENEYNNRRRKDALKFSGLRGEMILDFRKIGFKHN